jgi:hypothetical protein
VLSLRRVVASAPSPRALSAADFDAVVQAIDASAMPTSNMVGFNCLPASSAI